MNRYQDLASRTINKKLTLEEQTQHALHLMSAEVGEIHSLFQKVYQGHPLNDEHLMKECGDLLWGLAELCTSKGWNLQDIADMNIEKLKARYPEGFEVNRSLFREEGDI